MTISVHHFSCTFIYVHIGNDVTLVAVSRMVDIALEAAKMLQIEKGISCEVINLRTLRPLDQDAITSSVMKTHYLVTVDGGWPQYGVGSEIAATVLESECAPYLYDAHTVRSLKACIPSV